MSILASLQATSAPRGSPVRLLAHASLRILTHFHADFEVNETLANVTFALGRNFAGNIPVQRLNTPNNTLFFWGFERENGSLTAAAGERSNEPWGVWLNGGCVAIPN